MIISSFSKDSFLFNLIISNSFSSFLFYIVGRKRILCTILDGNGNGKYPCIKFFTLKGEHLTTISGVLPADLSQKLLLRIKKKLSCMPHFLRVFI